MKKYVTHNSGSNLPKNNLEAAVIGVLKRADRIVINEGRAESVMEEIVLRIKRLNEEYPRCTPLDPKFYKQHINEDFHLHNIHFANFCLLKCEEDA